MCIMLSNDSTKGIQFLVNINAEEKIEIPKISIPIKKPRKTRPMNIEYSWSGNINNLGPAIYSVLNSVQNRSINFYVTSNTEKMVPGFWSRLQEIQVEGVTFQAEYINCEITKKKIEIYSWDAYAKILFADKHPKLKKFMHLDGDTILLDDISEFYDKDLTGKHANVCIDKEVTSEGFDPYFNSGVMVFNAAKFREDRMKKRALETLKLYEKNVEYWTVDQTVLNDIFKYNCIYSDRKYNEYDMTYYNKAKIFHFNKIVPPYKHYDIETMAHKKWKCFKYFFQNRINPWKEDRFAKICETDEDIMKYSNIA